MQNKSKEFKKLQKTWYKKLKDSGFNDLESGDDLRDMRSNAFPKASADFIDNEDFSSTRIKHDAKEEYYRKASQFLWEHNFKDATHKFIWERHADGVSMRNISKALLAEKGIKLKRNAVHTRFKLVLVEFKKYLIEGSSNDKE